MSKVQRYLMMVGMITALTTAMFSAGQPANADVLHQCSGNPHDDDSGHSGNPHDNGESGNPHDKINLPPHHPGPTEHDNCPGSK